MIWNESTLHMNRDKQPQYRASAQVHTQINSWVNALRDHPSISRPLPWWSHYCYVWIVAVKCLWMMEYSQEMSFRSHRLKNTRTELNQSSNTWVQVPSFICPIYINIIYIIHISSQYSSCMFMLYISMTSIKSHFGRTSLDCFWGLLLGFSWSIVSRQGTHSKSNKAQAAAVATPCCPAPVSASEGFGFFDLKSCPMFKWNGFFLSL